jgi:predicted transposase YbfD/YdcC
MSPTHASPTIATYFAELKDPRVERTKRHSLLAIVSIALCAIFGGADSWVEVAEYGQVQQEWLGRWLELPNGVPSHDTFGRVFAAVDPLACERCFARWVQAVAQALGAQVIDGDGKVLRGSHDGAAGRSARNLVSAWASANRLVLAQVAVADGSNEIPAVPVLLRTLALAGCIVTVDARGCQTAIARQIREQQAHYVLALKANQETLHQAVEEAFAALTRSRGQAYRHERDRWVDKGHGRVEVGTTTLITDPTLLAYLNPDDAWPDLAAVVRVVARRRVAGTPSQETRYYLSSLTTGARHHQEAIRGHWGIENSVRWVLDVVFREHLSRVRRGHAGRNFSLMRRLALNLLRQDHTARCGIKGRRFKAALSPAYLLTVLNGSF